MADNTLTAVVSVEPEKSLIGVTLKNIRSKKGFSAKEIAWQTISPAQLSRVENRNQVPATDSFIKLLHRLNISFEEFFLLSEEEHARVRIETKNEIADIMRTKNKKRLKATIKKMSDYYKTYHDPYFNHMECILKAALILSETKYDYNKVSDVVKPIRDYLSSIETWFAYEISLFTNCMYLYSVEESVKIGNKILKNIKKNYALLKDVEFTSSLLLNLAIYSLSDKAYYSDAHRFANMLLSLPQTTNFLYNSLLAKFVIQIAYYKLNNPEYDETYLTNLLSILKLMKFEDIYQDLINFLVSHSITLEHV